MLATTFHLRLSSHEMANLEEAEWESLFLKSEPSHQEHVPRLEVRLSRYILYRQYGASIPQTI